MRRATRRLAGLCLLALATAACGDGGSTAAPSAGDDALEGTITVSAAASLRDAFTEIADDFTAAHPDVDVVLNVDASSALGIQIREGAPADVFASADEADMRPLVDEGLVVGVPQIFARNELVVVTEPGNPEGIDSLADLTDAGVISLCGEEVPCGRYAQQALDAAGVAVPESSITRGQNVGATLTAVTEGDAVAGIVYVTDATAAGDAVATVPIPADVNVLATYPIGVLASSARSEVARAFVDHVVGDDGQRVLEAYGFLVPDG